jgi:hypothetical protein
MREKYPIKKFKISKCKYAKIRSFQKEIIQMKTEKVILLRKDIQEDFVKKGHP